jgi:hypothetical protein
MHNTGGIELPSARRFDSSGGRLCLQPAAAHIGVLLGKPVQVVP